MTLLEQAQSFSQIRGQVARILLAHAENGADGHNQLTQRDMAKMLGTGWDMIHLSLKSLYHEGIIRIERNRIIINKKLLQRAAQA